jgi:signal transduction histidine kinase
MRKYVLLLLILKITLVSFSQNKPIIDSLLNALKTTKELGHTILYSELAWEHLFYDISTAHEYALKSVEIAEKYKVDNDLSEAYNTLSTTHYRKGNYAESILYSEKAIVIREKLNDIRGLGASYSKLGLVYIDQGYFQKALEIQLKALDYFLQTDDKGAEAQTYNNICQIYNYLNNYEMAIFYADKCLKIYDEIDYPYGKALAIANKGINFEKQNMLDSAIYCHNLSRAVFEELGYNVEIANCENALGVIYRKLGDSKKGLEHYKNAYDYAVLENDMPSICQYAANMAAVQIDLGLLEEAFKNYELALKYAEEKDIQRVKRQCYDGFANYYEKKGDFKNALSFRKKYQTIHEKITSEETQKAMAQADALFQNTVNQQKILEQEAIIAKEQEAKAIAEKEKLEKEAKLERTKLWFSISIGIAIILVIGIAAFFNRKRLQREKLFAENLAAEQERGLQLTLTAQEEERQRIARDLHDGIVQDLTILKMNITQLEAHSESDVKLELPNIANKLDKASKEVRSISHQMMPLALRELGLSAALKDVLEKVLTPHKITFDFEEVEMEDRVPQVIEISLYRIAQELLNNVVKHSKASSVSVMLTKRNNFITMIFEDNGKGFTSTQKTDGIGMTSLNSRVKMVNGEIKFETEEGSGTMAIVKIPLTYM